MNDLNAQTAKIAKDLDRHRLLPRSEPQWLTVWRSSIDQSSRLCTTQ
jgi:hypothetical protein